MDSLAIASIMPHLTPRERVEVDRLLLTRPMRCRVFRGDNALALTLREEFILSGPAETGKTIACLTLLDRIARAHPGAQLSIVRKVQSDLEATVLQTYRDKILGKASDVHAFGGSHAEWFAYPNGSRVWVGGLDNPGKTLSSERDAVYVNQCEELSISDWETLTTRTTGRAGHVPLAFTCGDCNPRGSKHWILERAKAGGLRLLHSYHRDNPTLFDSAGNITPQGEITLARLGALTGLRKKRLHEGLWVQAEGMIYADWDPAVHVRSSDVGNFPALAIAADDGYTNPAALLWVGIDVDGRLHVLAEWYETQKIHSEIAAAALSMRFRFGRRPQVVVVDAAAAGLVGAMQSVGLPAIGHKGRVLDSINLVADLLKVRGDGRPRLTVDPGCNHFISEIEDYTWGSGSKEAPATGQADHAMTAIYYLAHYLYAPHDGEETRVGYAPAEITDKY